VKTPTTVLPPAEKPSAVTIPVDTTSEQETIPTKVEIPACLTSLNVENPVVLTPATPVSRLVKFAPEP